MARHSRPKKEEARRLFLTNEVTSVAEIARRMRVKAHTVARWKKEENWDGLRLQVERRAAEKMVEEIATEWVALNAQHHKYWNTVLGKLFETIQRQGARQRGTPVDRAGSKRRGESPTGAETGPGPSWRSRPMARRRSTTHASICRAGTLFVGQEAHPRFWACRQV